MHNIYNNGMPGLSPIS